MRAIILAAGQGTRLRPYTDSRPKCLVELCGRSLLEHQIDVLRTCGVKSIAVVGGYRSEMLTAYEVDLIVNEDFATTNMVFSLFCAREHLSGGSDILIVYGDIVFTPEVCHSAVNADVDIGVVVDEDWERYWRTRMSDPLSDAETLKLDDSGAILEVGKKPQKFEDIEGQYIGLIKVSAGTAAGLIAYYDELAKDPRIGKSQLDNMYMTSFIQSLIDNGRCIKSIPIESGWLEVDSVEDLELYREMHDAGTLSEFWHATGGGIPEQD